MDTDNSFSKQYYYFLKVFEKFFISQLKDETKEGTFIPAERVRNINLGKEYSDEVIIGDGTINIAHYLTFLILRNDFSTVNKCLHALRRLSYSAAKACKMQFDERLDFYEPGFFIRDDIDSYQHADFNTVNIHSNSTSCIEGSAEDPCHSSFESQDQVWNLIPPLMVLLNRTKNEKDRLLRYIFTQTNTFLQETLFYIIKHNHIIYNPYYSQLLHLWTYVPELDSNKLPFHERENDREKHLKYKVKVKRGAYNWYFAYGFRKVFQKVNPYKKLSKFKNFLYSCVYYPLIFFADRIYYPLLKGKVKQKDTSFYNLAMAGDVWYSKNFWKRVLKKYNKDGSHLEIVALMVYEDPSKGKDIDLGKLQERLVQFTKKYQASAVKESPITYLIEYQLLEIARNEQNNKI